jgi:hypothetical protein
LETALVLLAFADALFEGRAFWHFDTVGLIVPIVEWRVGNATVDEVFEEFSVRDRFLQKTGVSYAL